MFYHFWVIEEAKRRKELQFKPQINSKQCYNHDGLSKVYKEGGKVFLIRHTGSFGVSKHFLLL